MVGHSATDDSHGAMAPSPQARSQPSLREMRDMHEASKAQRPPSAKTRQLLTHNAPSSTHGQGLGKGLDLSAGPRPPPIGPSEMRRRRTALSQAVLPPIAAEAVATGKVEQLRQCSPPLPTAAARHLGAMPQSAFVMWRPAASRAQRPSWL